MYCYKCYITKDLTHPDHRFTVTGTEYRLTFRDESAKNEGSGDESEDDDTSQEDDDGEGNREDDEESE